ncbi:hypothetical protein ACOMHN_055515 [Nucella lapillus]
MALRTSRDYPHPPPTSPSSTPLLLSPHNVSVMSYQEFEQLPPLSEECTELPAMWEDGGALDSGREGYSVGGSFDDDPHWGPSPHDSSVQLFADSNTGGGGGGGVGGSSSSQTSEIHHSSLEQRSEVIEQTLSEIYASPFPQLMYAAAQHPSPASSTNNNPHHHHPRPSRKKKTSFQTPYPTTTTVDSTLKSRGPQENDNGRIPQESGLSSPNEEGEAEEMVEKRGERAEMFRLDDYDTHGTVKASIARAAKKAVSGYRSCDDADRYVGAQVKPTLILARAPPSPSGILRRTNRKTAAKVMQGSVRWADGKAPSLPPTDDVA